MNSKKSSSLAATGLAQSLLQSIRRDIFKVANAGTLCGSLAGFIALFGGGSAEQVGQQAVQWSWLLVIALPLGLWTAKATYQWSPAEQKAAHAMNYVQPNFAGRARLLLLVGCVGALIGITFEFVVANYVTLIFSGFKLDMVQLRAAMVANYPWYAASAAMLSTIISALVFAWRGSKS